MTSPRFAPVSAGRRGMTLVELLVVTGLIAVFLGLLVVGVQRKGGVEPLPSVFAAAHGRALGVPEGAAVILATGTGGEQNAADACTSIFEAAMLPLIEGTANVSFLPGTESANVAVTSLIGDDVQRAYKIQLFSGLDGTPVAPPTAWFQFTPVTGTSGVVAFRSTLGQTTGNTVWPKALGSGTFNARLAQYPAKSTAAFDVEQGMAIDLRFSGIGDDRSTPYGRLDRKGAIAVVFDRVGRVAEVVQQVPEPGQPATPGAAQPAIPVGTIYFLVVPRDQIVSSTNSNTLSSAEAKWVALVPQTGRVSVADNVPQTGTDTAAVQAARAKVRQGIGVGK